jgi:AcrR family transcriptional regulator
MAVYATNVNYCHTRRREMLCEHFLEILPHMLEDAEYPDITVANLMTAGAMSRASFYTYFCDKHDLLAGVGELALRDLAAAATEWWTLPPSEGCADIHRGLLEIASVYRRRRLLLRALVEGAHNAEVRESYRIHVAAGAARLKQYITDRQRAGSIARGLNAEDTAEMLIHMTDRALYQRIGIDNVLNVDDVARPLADMYARTLYPSGYAS